jgi:hypothetical protein
MNACGVAGIWQRSVRNTVKLHAQHPDGCAQTLLVRGSECSLEYRGEIDRTAKRAHKAEALAGLGNH